MTAATSEIDPAGDDTPAVTDRPGSPSWWSAHWYGAGLVVVAAVAAVIRFMNVLVWYPSCNVDLINSVENRLPYPPFAIT